MEYYDSVKKMISSILHGNYATDHDGKVKLIMDIFRIHNVENEDKVRITEKKREQNDG